MADTRITDLAEDTSPATNDFVVTVDVSDTTMAATGTDKKVQAGNLPLASKVTRTANGDLALTSQSTPGSLSDGELFHGTQKTLGGQFGGITHRFVGCLFSQTADAKLIASTLGATTDGSLVGAGVGTATLPANFWVAGKTVRVLAEGVYNTIASASASLTFKVKLGTVTLLAPTVAPPAVNNMVNRRWVVESRITCRTTGASGTLAAQGVNFQATGSTAGNSCELKNAAALTVDTTASAALDVTVQFSNATAAQDATCTNLTIEALN